MKTFNAEVAGAEYAEGINLVRLELPPLEPGIRTVLRIDKLGKTWLGGKQVDLPPRQEDRVRELARKLTTVRSNIQRAHGSGVGNRAVVAIDRLAEWFAIADLADAASSANYRELIFAFGLQTKLLPPGASDVDEEAKRGSTVELLGKVYGECQPALDLHSGLAPHQLSSDLIDKLGRAIKRCGCKVAFNAGKALLWHSMSNRRRSLAGGIRIRLPSQTKYESVHTVRVSEHTAWISAHRALLEGVRSATGQPIMLSRDRAPVFRTQGQRYRTPKGRQKLPPLPGF